MKKLSNTEAELKKGIAYIKAYIVWRSLSDIAFSDAKQLLVNCREQLRKKDIEFDPKISHWYQYQVELSQHKSATFVVR